MKINTFLKGIALSGATALGACAPAIDQQAEQQVEAVAVVPAAPATTAVADPIVERAFLGGTFSWSESGGFLYRYTAIERDGEVYICGVYARNGSSNSRRASSEAMRLAKITANGETIMRDLRFFAIASSANFDNGLVGSDTNCRSTRRTTDDVPLSAPGIEFHTGRYRIRV